MNVVQQIKEIRDEIFNLIKEAENLEIIHWYTALDECFENDEFQRSESGNLRWRMWVLTEKKEPLRQLFSLVEPLLQYYGLIDDDKEWVGKDRYTPEYELYGEDK